MPFCTRNAGSDTHVRDVPFELGSGIDDADRRLRRVERQQRLDAKQLREDAAHGAGAEQRLLMRRAHWEADG